MKQKVQHFGTMIPNKSAKNSDQFAFKPLQDDVTDSIHVVAQSEKDKMLTKDYKAQLDKIGK